MTKGEDMTQYLQVNESKGENLMKLFHPATVAVSVACRVSAVPSCSLPHSIRPIRYSCLVR